MIGIGVLPGIVQVLGMRQLTMDLLEVGVQHGDGNEANEENQRSYGSASADIRLFWSQAAKVATLHPLPRDVAMILELIVAEPEPEDDEKQHVPD